MCSQSTNRHTMIIPSSPLALEISLASCQSTQNVTPIFAPGVNPRPLRRQYGRIEKSHRSAATTGMMRMTATIGIFNLCGTSDVLARRRRTGRAEQTNAFVHHYTHASDSSSSSSERLLFSLEQIIGSVEIDVEPDLNTDFAQAPKKVCR